MRQSEKLFAAGASFTRSSAFGLSFSWRSFRHWLWYRRDRAEGLEQGSGFAAKPKSLLQAENLQEKSACESDPKQLKTMCEFADTFRQPTAGLGRARLHPWSNFKSLD